MSLQIALFTAGLSRLIAGLIIGFEADWRSALTWLATSVMPFRLTLVVIAMMPLVTFGFAVVGIIVSKRAAKESAV